MVSYSAEILERYSTENLEAVIAKNDRFAPGPKNRAVELLKLDTPARRARAESEGDIITNLEGGVPSQGVACAVSSLLKLIEEGREDEELRGEETNRRFLEGERRKRGY
jgi:hypothetical protein